MINISLIAILVYISKLLVLFLHSKQVGLLCQSTSKTSGNKQDMRLNFYKIDRLVTVISVNKFKYL